MIVQVQRPDSAGNAYMMWQWDLPGAIAATMPLKDFYAVSPQSQKDALLARCGDTWILDPKVMVVPIGHESFISGCCTEPLERRSPLAVGPCPKCANGRGMLFHWKPGWMSCGKCDYEQECPATKNRQLDDEIYPKGRKNFLTGRVATAIPKEVLERRSVEAAVYNIVDPAIREMQAFFATELGERLAGEFFGEDDSPSAIGTLIRIVKGLSAKVGENNQAHEIKRLACELVPRFLSVGHTAQTSVETSVAAAIGLDCLLRDAEYQRLSRIQAKQWAKSLAEKAAIQIQSKEQPNEPS